MNNDCTFLWPVKVSDIYVTSLYGLLYMGFPMGKLFIWSFTWGICGLGNFQFSAEFNNHKIENQK